MCQEKQEFETYDRDCVKLAKQDTSRPSFATSCSKWRANGCTPLLINKMELTLPTGRNAPFDTIEPSGSAAQAKCNPARRA